MAEKKKTSTASKSSKKASKPRTTASKQAAASAKQRKPIRREVGGVICLGMAVLALLGIFRVDAVFIDLVTDLFRGLIGAGYYVAPFALFMDFIILLFHDGRPVRLRVLGTVGVAVCVGILVHLLGNPAGINWEFAMVGELWRTGVAGTSGGLVAGFLAMFLQLLIHKIGAAILSSVVLILSLLICFDMTVISLIRAIRARPRPVAYDPPVREHKDPAETIVNHVAQKHIEHVERKRSKVSDFDLPVDEPPALKKTTEKPAKEKKVETPVPEEPPVEEKLEMPEWPSLPEIPTPAGEEKQPSAVQTQFEAALIESVKPHKTSKKLPEPDVPEVEVPQKIKKEEAMEEAAKIAAEITATDDQPKEYAYPPVSLLDSGDGKSVDGSEEMRINAERLDDTLASFGIDAHIINVIRGPSVTRYELELDRGVKLSKITNLADDIALALGASGVRISAIPDKISVVGIEVPNKLVSTVRIHDVIDSLEFFKSKSRISFAVGKDISGTSIVGDIAKLPHLLIAGTTGSGKSVCMNSLIISLLYKAKPEEVRLIMVDPKMVELGIYNGIPHLLIPVVTDPKKAAGALQWAVTEMMKRYRLMADAGVRDLESYNKTVALADDDRKPLEQIVVVIDELADLMLVAAKEVEEAICRVAQMGRASGIHLVIATQRPSADVITGLMKANIPSRIAFAVASAMESRIILDTAGAEKLVGKGDMLYAPLGQGKPQRVQGCFIRDEEVQAVVDFIKSNATATYDDDVMDQINQKAEQSGKNSGSSAAPVVEAENDGDEMLPAAVEVFLETGQGSVSMLQRRLKLGYARAARIVDEMEEKGLVGPYEGSKPRQLLVTKEQWMQMQGLVPMEENPPVEEEIP